MAGNKRERELARAKYERQQARRAQQSRGHRQRQRVIAAIVVAVLVVGAVAWVIVGRTSEADLAAAPLPSQTPIASESGAPDHPALLDCTAPGTPRPDTMAFADGPDESTTAAKAITFDTNCGPIVVTLDPNAPKTTLSETFLASSGFYDNTTCHRLTTSGIFVLQCGDPKGDGTGGPGYSVPDENLPSAEGVNYPAGTVAMANAGPGTSGSQFFLVYDDTTLPAGYTIWGTVTEGLDLIKEIASVGTTDGGGDGTPRQPVFIESATVQS